MKLGVNAELLYQPQMRGWNRYTINLLEALLNEYPELHLVLYSQKKIAPEILQRLSTGNRLDCRIAAESMRYFPWLYRWLPRSIREDGLDLFHSPFNYGLPLIQSCPQVITIHDVIYKITPTGTGRFVDRLKMQFLHWQAVKSANAILTVSQYSRDDIVRHLKVKRELVHVVYEAADPIYNQTELALPSERVGKVLKKPFFFYMGGFDPRKNIPFLIDAFAKLKEEALLVLAGGEPTEEIVRLVKPIAKKVVFLGRVSDNDAAHLYRNAVAFVYPSLYEGFGLQIVEAFASHCPVFAADATSLTEIVGSGGHVFSLEKPSHLVELMKKIIADNAFREEARMRAKNRGKEFSWKTTARETMEVYESIRGIR